MSAGGFRVRYAIFKGRAGVYYPSGHDAGSKKRGFPTVPPPRYEPPREQSRLVGSVELARDLVRELRLEHGEQVVVHVEPVDAAATEPRPQQTSLADGWPRQRQS